MGLIPGASKTLSGSGLISCVLHDMQRLCGGVDKWNYMALHPYTNIYQTGKELALIPGYVILRENYETGL